LTFGKRYWLGALLSLPSLTWAQSVTLFPGNGAQAVNPDVQLRLSFEQTPSIGSAGEIRIYDAADGRLVDTLDLSVPPGPTERRAEAADAWYLEFPYPYDELPRGRTNANTTPGTPTAGAVPPPPGYQLTIIGGFTDGFHFYPVIFDGTTAIVQPHHNLLEYGKRYYVEMDPAVLTIDGVSFGGFSGPDGWAFSTKPASMAPAEGATQIVVAADGSGDFHTVQGAMDWIPDDNASRIQVDVNPGVYHEIVYFRRKHNVTIGGEAPGAVRITYSNNEIFNPHPDNIRTNEVPGSYPSRRAAFAADNSNDLHLINLILETTAYGQAEGLLITGERNVLDHVDVIGSGDALQVNGSAYIVDSTVTGDGDTILGRGPAFFKRCTIASGGVMMWIRNTAGNHGNVFHDCVFRGTGNNPTTLARSPTNNVSTYPYAEAVIMNSTLINIAPEGWGPAHDGDDVHFWEFDNRDADGNPIDTSGRAPWSRQLDAARDAAIIESYRDPAYVLGGWTPPQANR
jgi:pectinesterase